MPDHYGNLKRHVGPPPTPLGPTGPAEEEDWLEDLKDALLVAFDSVRVLDDGRIQAVHDGDLFLYDVDPDTGYLLALDPVDGSPLGAWSREQRIVERALQDARVELDRAERVRQFDETAEFNQLQLGYQKASDEADRAERVRQFDETAELDEADRGESARQFNVRLSQDDRHHAENIALGREGLTQENRHFLANLGLDYDRLAQEDRQFLQRLGFDRERLQEETRQFDLGHQLDRDRFGAELLASGRNFLGAASYLRGVEPRGVGALDPLAFNPPPGFRGLSGPPGFRGLTAPAAPREADFTATQQVSRGPAPTREEYPETPGEVADRRATFMQGRTEGVADLNARLQAGERSPKLWRAVQKLMESSFDPTPVTSEHAYQQALIDHVARPRTRTVVDRPGFQLAQEAYERDLAAYESDLAAQREEEARRAWLASPEGAITTAPPAVQDILFGRQVRDFKRTGGTPTPPPSQFRRLTTDERGALDTVLRRSEGITVDELEQESRARFLGPQQPVGFRRARLAR